jgi:hypothetical protein
MNAPRSASTPSTPSSGSDHEPEDAPASDSHVQTAGAFDIRIFIGSLIGIFGVVLTLLGLFAFDAAAAEKTGGLNANLWAGLTMILAAIVFFAWTKLQPIRMIVRDNEPGAEEPQDIAGV